MVQQMKKAGIKMLAALLTMGFAFMLSCSTESNDSGKSLICGLATPLIVTSDTFFFHTSDYVHDQSLLKEITFPGEISAVEIDSGIFRLVKSENLPKLSTIGLTAQDGGEYAILIKNLAKEKVTIKYNPGDKKCKSVKVRGSLNRWNVNASKMKNVDGIWTEVFELPAGEYQYLLVVDGLEMKDPVNPDSIDNGFGGYNSILRVGTYEQENMPFIRSVSFNKNTIELESSSVLKEIYAFLDNTSVPAITDGNSITVKIPGSSKKEERSYVRVIGDDERGISNDLLIPLEYGKVITDASKLTRFDRQTMIMYFMMIDRFYNGNPGNDEPVDDPDILPKANHYGGDIAGVLSQLNNNYFQELGTNTIWLSPITQNPKGAYGLYPEPRTKFSGYHGYWPISSLKIDYRFGTDQELRDLIQKTHENDMNIILDYVANHVHELHPVYQLHPDWATNLYLPDGTLNTERWDDYRLTTWFDVFLPTLDLSRPEVIEPMTDSAIYWITEFGLDGFRHDATKHIDELFWRRLTLKLKEATDCDPMIFQIGETYGSPELIASYVSSGMLDGQFDFNVYDNTVSVLGRDEVSFDRLKSTLDQSLRYYGYHNQMGYITGNQDRPRFISLAGGDLKFGENSKYAGWNREIGIGDSTAYDKLIMLHAFNLTIPGIPVIYYGDEIGLPGANDPDNRRWMKFDNLNPREMKVRNTVSKLISVRKSSMALLYGDLKFLHTDNKTFAYIRCYFDDIALVIFNKDSEPAAVTIDYPAVKDKTLKSLFGSRIEKDGENITIELEANSFDIIKSD
ncbi:MAG: alpha-glucosidase C-terminal domain-containing protein [Bacteroidales bacterium]|nr:alpha-glucosidase C-terminal domain-containing protein [Bacteroidales bacterium]